MKYKELLKGLEVSEVMLSELERTCRIDSEFYQKENLSIQELLKNNNAIKLTDMVGVSDGNHMSISDNFCETGIPYYRGQDIHDFFIENATPICIPESVFRIPTMYRSHLKKGDVLLSIVGTIGEVSLVNFDNNATCSCKLAILRPKAQYKSEIIAIFLQSKYGQNQIKKFIRGAVQMGFILEDANQIFIPQFSNIFQSQIEQIVKSAHSKLQQSRSLYSEAEDILLSELGLKGWRPNNAPVNIKQLKDSFLASGRLDAEYYQQKYDELLKKLSKYECDTLIHIANTKKSVEPGSEAYQDCGIPFVRVSDISKFGISEPQIFLSPNDFDLNDLQPKKDTILLSKDGSVGIAYKVEEDLDCITSGALLHLSVFNKDYTPDYLTLVLNSIVVQMQAERDSNGAIIQHWKPSEIEQVIIPKLPKPIQETISAKIQESFALQAESKRLLEEAKMMVEREIEA